jgi:transposase InsO family protein
VAEASPAGSSSTPASTTTRAFDYVEVLGDECAQTGIDFLGRAIAWFAEHGIEVRAVLSDNGSCYRRRFSEACRALGLKHLHTRPTGRAPTAKPSASSRR